jgi:hypothetical protein
MSAEGIKGWDADKVVGIFTATEGGILKRGRDDVAAMLKRGEAAEHFVANEGVTAADLVDLLIAANVVGMSAGRISQYRKAFRHYGIDADAAVASIPTGNKVNPENVLKALPKAAREPRTPNGADTGSSSKATGEAKNVKVSLTDAVQQTETRLSELTDAELLNLFHAVKAEMQVRRAQGMQAAA